jgi:hypothetical protein
MHPGVSGKVVVRGDLVADGKLVCNNSTDVGAKLSQLEINAIADRETAANLTLLVETQTGTLTASINAAATAASGKLRIAASTLNTSIQELETKLTDEVASVTDSFTTTIEALRQEAAENVTITRAELLCLQKQKGAWLAGKCLDGWPSCAHLPRSAPSGYYDIIVGESEVRQAYCEMRRVGGGWTLCGHVGGATPMGGDNHWYNTYGDKRVRYDETQQEATWCGDVPAIADVMFSTVRTRKADRVNLYNNKCNGLKEKQTE